MTKPSEGFKGRSTHPLSSTKDCVRPVDPEAAASQMVINAPFVFQACSRRKLQNVDRVLAMTGLRIIEIADKVFRNRDMETKREVEKRQREDNKRADQKVIVLAAALGGSLSKPLQPSLNQNQPHGRPSTRRPRAALQPNQCARCWGFGHWKNECPRNSRGKDLASAVIGLARLETE